LFSVPSGGVDSRIFNDGSGNFIIGHGTNSSTPTERMRIDSSGRLGVGTSSPSSPLHVKGAIQNASLQDYGIAAFENTNSEGLSIGYDADSNFTYLYSREVGVGSRGLHLNGSIYVSGYGNNVGIGTTSPSAKLDVAGTVSSNSDIRITGTSGKYVINSLDLIEYSGGFRIGAVADDDEALTLVGFGGQPNIVLGDSAIQFKYSTNEKMRLDSSGNLFIAKTSANTATVGIELQANGLFKATRNGSHSLTLNRLTSDGDIAIFKKDGTTVGTISVTGSATTYNTSSDVRLKDDIGDFDGLGIVEQLNPRKFAWKADKQEDIGLYAQEVKELVPNAVSETEDGYYQMDYSKLVTPLIKAVQEQQEQIEELKQEIKELKK